MIALCGAAGVISSGGHGLWATPSGNARGGPLQIYVPAAKGRNRQRRAANSPPGAVKSPPYKAVTGRAVARASIPIATDNRAGRAQHGLLRVLERGKPATDNHFGSETACQGVRAATAAEREPGGRRPALYFRIKSRSSAGFTPMCYWPDALPRTVTPRR